MVSLGRGNVKKMCVLYRHDLQGKNQSKCLHGNTEECSLVSIS